MNLSLTGLMTGGGFLVALGMWFGLIYWNSVSKISHRQLFTVILTVGFACRIAFSLFTPTFYAPDEQSHFNYIKYLAENRSLPVQTSQTDSPGNDWEYYQPPVYYLSLTPFYLLSEKLFHDPFITVRFLRGFSIISWGITILFTFKFLNSVQVQDIFLRVFVVSMMCLLPTYTFLSSVINNDNLLVAVGSGILYLSIQPNTGRNSLLLGLLLGIALLVKFTAVVYVVLLMLLLLIRLVKRTPGQTLIHHFVLQMALAVIIWAPWAVRNYYVYGSITAEEVANVAAHWPTFYDAVVSTFEYMQMSFWAVSGIFNNVGSLFPLIGVFVFYCALIGLIYGFLFKRQKFTFLLPKDFTVMLALALAILINVLLIFRFGVLYGQGQGRFLFPLLIPFSLFMGMGLRMVLNFDNKNSSIHLVGFFSTYALTFMLFSLMLFTAT